MGNTSQDNTIWYGDNLEIMKKMAFNSIDLIYLDPPFNSKRNYNQIYKDAHGRPLPEEALAFCDAWTLTEEKENQIRNFANELLSQGARPDFVKFWETWILALRHTNKALLSYLVFMTVRLWHMHCLLKDTGSIYLHCDPTASHYIKIIMDGVFGHDNFVNEIIWHYQTGGASKRHFSRKHDVIFLYSKSKNYYFCFDNIKVKRTAKSISRASNPKGARIQAGDELKIAMDVWTEIQALNPMAKERLGYPTQKPLALLERIIKASCPQDGIVLDPFCGCGTTLDAAQKLNRKWIGIDICLLAAQRMEQRLRNQYPHLEKGKDYDVKGIPITLNQVDEMIHTSNKSKNEGRYQFQYWAIEQVEGFASTRKSGDGGVDGAIYFYKSLEDAHSKKPKALGRMILSVKSNKKMQISYVRDLIGTMHNEGADMAGMICVDTPTEGMYATAREVGMIKIEGIMGHIIKIPRVQILTTKDLFDSKQFNFPDWSKLKKPQT